MTDKRENDTDTRRSWLRSGSRAFESNGRWYFQTREGTVEGPFSDRYSAQNVLDEYVKVMRSSFASSLTLEPIEEERDSPRSAFPFDLGMGRHVR
ncbi:MAG: hypothetical protein H7A12_09470 [Pseudomonadales bacterium]|jgi:hypothetical protein|nr:hypothetical protein [Pseudomonadales bacterium]MCP5337358.1 hypothetical protein [Pseudomonadales bacterium]